MTGFAKPQATNDELARNKIFEEFCQDQASIEALHVTPKEMEALSRASLLGTLSSKRDIEFVLSQLRKPWIRSAEAEASVANVAKADNMTETIRQAALANLQKGRSDRRHQVWQGIKLIIGWTD
ncbi:MAG: hypothetical protein ACREQH_14280 [Candidatus Binatus sp.]